MRRWRRSKPTSSSESPSTPKPTPPMLLLRRRSGGGKAGVATGAAPGVRACESAAAGAAGSRRASLPCAFPAVAVCYAPHPCVAAACARGKGRACAWRAVVGRECFLALFVCFFRWVSSLPPRSLSLSLFLSRLLLLGVAPPLRRAHPPRAPHARTPTRTAASLWNNTASTLPKRTAAAGTCAARPGRGEHNRRRRPKWLRSTRRLRREARRGLL